MPQPLETQNPKKKPKNPKPRTPRPELRSVATCRRVACLLHTCCTVCTQDARILEAARAVAAEEGLRILALPFDRHQLTGHARQPRTPKPETLDPKPETLKI